jgi:hypothetical protein
MSDERIEFTTVGELEDFIRQAKRDGRLTRKSRVSTPDLYGSTNYGEKGGTLGVYDEADEDRGIKGGYLAIWGRFA